MAETVYSRTEMEKCMDYAVAEPLLERIAHKVHARQLESFCTTLLQIDKEVYRLLVNDTETNPWQGCFNISTKQWRTWKGGGGPYGPKFSRFHAVFRKF